MSEAAAVAQGLAKLFREFVGAESQAGPLGYCLPRIYFRRPAGPLSVRSPMQAFYAGRTDVPRVVVFSPWDPSVVSKRGNRVSVPLCVVEAYLGCVEVTVDRHTGPESMLPELYHRGFESRTRLELDDPRCFELAWELVRESLRKLSRAMRCRS